MKNGSMFGMRSINAAGVGRLDESTMHAAPAVRAIATYTRSIRSAYPRRSGFRTSDRREIGIALRVLVADRCSAARSLARAASRNAPGATSSITRDHTEQVRMVAPHPHGVSRATPYFQTRSNSPAWKTPGIWPRTLPSRVLPLRPAPMM
jgi:hypothetical protein